MLTPGGAKVVASSATGQDPTSQRTPCQLAAAPILEPALLFDDRQQDVLDGRGCLVALRTREAASGIDFRRYL